MGPSAATDIFANAQLGELATLRRVLRDAGYTGKGLIDKLGSIDIPTRRARNLPRLMRLTKAGERLDTLIRLFLFGVRVEVDAARAALDPLPLEALYRADLAAPLGDGVAGTVVLCPYGDLIVAFDHPEQVSTGARPDMVMGITSSTMDLVQFTVRRKVRTALDLGTGSGLQAMLAAAHAGHVWGVDRSPRAIAFARLNIALNGLENVECLEGDRFEPVGDRRFDLIVGNLPFVIAPSARYLYRDSGMEMDTFTRSVLQAAPAHLEEGGICQLICEWVHPAGEDPTERLASWFRGSGCDVWVLRLAMAKPLTYAEAWIRDTEQDDPEVAARTYDEWADYHERLGVEAISTGVIAMRRVSGLSHWFYLEETDGHVPEQFGENLLRAFASRDFLRSMPENDDLLSAHLMVAPDVHLVADNSLTPEGWRATQARLMHTTGLKRAGDVNSHMAKLLALCDGARTLREALAEYASSLGADFDRVATPCLPIVRELISGGFVVPKEGNL